MIIQNKYTDDVDIVFQLYKDNYNTFLSRAYSFDDYIGKDKNLNFRELQYFTYPIWLTLFIIEQNEVRKKSKAQIITDYELEALRKCFACFGVDVDVAISTIDFNEVLEETGSVIAGVNGINLAAINTTFKINGGLVTTAPPPENTETIDLLDELNN